ncbi:8820_t:CDS:2, partial [Funneliformis geosporum]
KKYKHASGNTNLHKHLTNKHSNKIESVKLKEDFIDKYFRYILPALNNFAISDKDLHKLILTDLYWNLLIKINTFLQ